MGNLNNNKAISQFKTVELLNHPSSQMFQTVAVWLLFNNMNNRKSALEAQG